MPLLQRGILLSLEGIDGSGKSTLAQALAAHFSAQGISVVLTKEPGGSHLGSIVRTLVHQKEVAICPKSEFLLFAADRAQHFEQIVLPALREKKLVISDRMADSSLVYQGFGRGLDLDMIETINRWAMQGQQPDVVIYVTIPLDISLQRLRARNAKLTSFEQENTDFIQKLINGFNTIFKNKHNVIWLDGTQTPEDLTNKAVKELTVWIQQHYPQ